MALIKELTDRSLVAKLKDLVAEEKKNVASQIALLKEIKARRLALELGYPSLMAFCEEELGLTKDQAWKRSQAAGAVEKEPELFQMLAKGQTSLSALAVVAPKVSEHTTEEIKQFLPQRSKREVEAFVSNLRKDGSRTARPQTVRRAFDISLGTEAKLKQAARLLRQNNPELTEADVIDAALDLLLEKRDPVRKAQRAQVRKQRKIEMAAGARNGVCSETAPGQSSSQAQRAQMRGQRKNWNAAGARKGVCSETASMQSPSPRMKLHDQTRYIPAQTRHEIYLQRGECSYVGKSGKRCSENHGLHIDHKQPFSQGGGHVRENLRLMCPAHNRFIAPVRAG